MSPTALSFPKLIHETSSKYNEKIEVYQVGKHRQLSVDNIVQSISWETPSAKKRIWGRMVETVKKLRPKAQNILIFGLGGGTMIHLFAKEMPSAHITVVEIDEVMIKIAQDYFDLASVPNLTLIQADALRVISEPEKFTLHQKTFDVCIVDIYCGDKYPDLGKTGNFFTGTKNLTKTDGLVVFNRIYFGHHQIDVDEFKELVENVYRNVSTVTIAGRTNSDNILIHGDV